MLHICLSLAGVPGIARVNKKIIILFLYPFSPSVPFPPTPFSLAFPGFHLPSPYTSYPIKVLVGLPVEPSIQAAIKRTVLSLPLLLLLLPALSPFAVIIN